MEGTARTAQWAAAVAIVLAVTGSVRADSVGPNSPSA